MTPFSYIDAQTSELAADLRTLVGFDTTNPPGRNYADVTAHLVREMTRSGLKARRFAISPALLRRALPAEQHGFPRYNVVGKWAVPGARKTIHFNAHYDVVPVSGEWRHGNPFGGAVSNGWIYGRGTADMKGSIASLLLALRALRMAKATPLVNVEVSFTADEETDSALGTGWLVKHAPIEPDYAIVMEGGDLNRVCCGHNGVVWLEVTVHGKAAHGSTPERGINAVEHMAALVTDLERYKDVLRKRSFATPESKMMVPTINVGGEFGPGPGGKINTVPALARFTIDRRVLAVESVAQAEKDLRAFLAASARRIPRCRITVTKLSESQPCFMSPTHSFFAAMSRCVGTVRRQKPVFSVSTGFNDMHFFASELKIPTLGYGPGGQAHHAVDERASLKELLASAKIYASLLTSFGG